MRKFLLTTGALVASLISIAAVQPKEETKVTTDCCNNPIEVTASNSADEISMEIFGIWQTLDNEFVQITRDMDYKITFMRVAKTKALLAKGFISGDQSTLSIERTYPVEETYSSQYVFSPSMKTLVIMKPNSNEAWVLHKVQ
ncbi:MAG: hypothetical protein HWD84_08430 [Flavobacteriaceae bacterium]|jgi:hypothetical protein|nr:hypothetical protein [Flavobacteriaceae bacterium]NVJ73282.1 hypothetical protein [Flavobacteriaceae bacterium]